MMTGLRLVARPSSSDPRAPGSITWASAQPVSTVCVELGLDPAHPGLSTAEAARRRAAYGPNAIASHGVRGWRVLWHQLRSPLLVLLLAAAAASWFVGERNDAVIIAVILALSVGLGFVNEYRAERAAAVLHSQIRRTALAHRDGALVRVPVSELVPGDVVAVGRGDLVPADLRLIGVEGLQCEESALTGEAFAVEKGTDALPTTGSSADLTNCAWMGTVVRNGHGTGVVVATGRRTQLGRIAGELGEEQTATPFQAGLRRFSALLVVVAGLLTAAIFVANLALQRPLLDSLLFSLAIAVGITPQLLPAVVATSLATGSRQLARRKVLVKRLVCIEDLGDVDLLLTDKTGTLTRGSIDFMRGLPIGGRLTDLLRAGLLCARADSDDPAALSGLEAALWRSPATAVTRRDLGEVTARQVLPFDHDRRLTSVIAPDPRGEKELITMGAPESVLDRCRSVPAEATQQLDREFRAGSRVVAVAARPWPGGRLDAAAESELALLGLLVFSDPPKADAARSLRRLGDLGIRIKVVTGDNAEVARTVCARLGLEVQAVLTGAELATMTDDQLAAAVDGVTVFARVGPEQKARIIHAQRRHAAGIAFLGDGVNDALALHSADVGISVDSAADVAKDAADVILLEKSLAVLADGVTEGRRIFANTMKYIQMGTSSNFGNMFSAAGASVLMSFLPMLPAQILLNNLLYDASQLTIPTDNVDPEQLRRPSHWDIRFIRRFMIVFGLTSSIFDYLTFGLLWFVFHAGAAEFRTGWFVESLATQVLVIFAIRTKAVPFFRSTPSVPLLLSSLLVVAVGALLPLTPLAAPLGFAPLPGLLYGALAALALTYLALIELTKRAFYARRRPRPPHHGWSPERHLQRRAGRFTSRHRVHRVHRVRGASGASGEAHPV